jgi:hypothetical protein
MTWVDETRDQPAIETLRDFIITKQWYSPDKKGIRQITNTNLITCFDSVLERKDNLSLRTLSKFFVVGINSFEFDTCRGIFS